MFTVVNFHSYLGLKIGLKWDKINLHLPNLTKLDKKVTKVLKEPNTFTDLT